MAAWREVDGGIELAVRAKPRSAKPGIDQVVTDADGSTWLVIRVAAPAEDGRANTALVQEVARALGVNRSAVSLVAGHAARRKRLRIEGFPGAILSALEKYAS